MNHKEVMRMADLGNTQLRRAVILRLVETRPHACIGMYKKDGHTDKSVRTLHKEKAW